MINLRFLKARRAFTAVAAFGLMSVALPVSAAAETVPVDHVSCAGQGLATVSPPIATVGGSGTYNFTGPGVCVASGDPSDAGTMVGTISSGGTFNNIVCGTGTATGTASVTIAGETYTVSYTITFVGGQGTFTSVSLTDSDGSSGGTGGGNAHIVPTGGDCVTGVTAFTVVYSFHAAVTGV
ncbi:MAG: hypothetical protein NVS3B24_04000 [Candidatus Dormibacteria bacterium]